MHIFSRSVGHAPTHHGLGRDAANDHGHAPAKKPSSSCNVAHRASHAATTAGSRSSRARAAEAVNARQTVATIASVDTEGAMVKVGLVGTDKRERAENPTDQLCRTSRTTTRTNLWTAGETLSATPSNSAKDCVTQYQHGKTTKQREVWFCKCGVRSELRVGWNCVCSSAKPSVL